jgi:hypothetical protein
MNKINVKNVTGFSLLVCIIFFLLSNFFVWNSGSGFGRPHTFEGLMLCYADGLPFLGYSIAATLLFSGILFGGWKVAQISRVSRVSRQGAKEAQSREVF